MQCKGCWKCFGWSQVAIWTRLSLYDGCCWKKIGLSQVDLWTRLLCRYCGYCEPEANVNSSEFQNTTQAKYCLTDTRGCSGWSNQFKQNWRRSPLDFSCCRLGLTRIKMRNHYAVLILVCVDVIHYVLEMTKDGKSAAKASNVGFEDWWLFTVALVFCAEHALLHSGS